MIVPMKKITIIVVAEEAQEALKKLRAFGAVHIEQEENKSTKDLAVLNAELSCVNQAIDFLKEAGFQFGWQQPTETITEKPESHYSLCTHIIEVYKRYLRLREHSSQIYRQIESIKSWGNFDPEEINQLAKRGLILKLYRIPSRKISQLPQNLIVEKISTQGQFVLCAIISERDFHLEYQEQPLPKKGLSKLKEESEENERIMTALKEQLRVSMRYLIPLQKIKKELEKECEFMQILANMGKTEKLQYLVGYLPFDQEEGIKKIAKQEGWGLIIEDPSEEDVVPTLIRNPRIISLIQPIFKLLEIVPGYNEFDISFLFLIFLSIFFGILIGDAGYGLCYLLLTLFLHKKFASRKKDHELYFLSYGLSIFAIIWGLLNFTFFGQNWLARLGWKPLFPLLQNPLNIQRLCFYLGAIHLSLAHFYKGMLMLPKLTCIGEVGWIFILWSALLLAKHLILKDALPLYFNILLISGMMMVILFSAPNKNIFSRIGVGMKNLLLNLVSNFTDIVSYIRLYAVGLAGVAIADTFNQLALNNKNNNPVSFILSVVVILVGHSLNLILGPLSVIVHGLRLNLLEFSLHAGISWSGKQYRPFQEKLE